MNLTAGALTALLLAAVLRGILHDAGPLHTPVSDGIERVALDTIYLRSSGMEADFSDVILSGQNETRKLIVSTQTGTVTTKLTDRLITRLDFDFLKKTQNVSCAGTGYFVVDLDHLPPPIFWRITRGRQSRFESATPICRSLRSTRAGSSSGRSRRVCWLGGHQAERGGLRRH